MQGTKSVHEQNFKYIHIYKYIQLGNMSVKTSSYVETSLSYSKVFVCIL